MTNPSAYVGPGRFMSWLPPEHVLSKKQQVDYTLQNMLSGGVATTIIGGVSHAYLASAHAASAPAAVTSLATMSGGAGLALGFGIGPMLWIGTQILTTLIMNLFRVCFPRKWATYQEYQAMLRPLIVERQRRAAGSLEYHRLSQEIKALKKWPKIDRSWDTYRGRIDALFKSRADYAPESAEYGAISSLLETEGGEYQTVEEWQKAREELNGLYHKRRKVVFEAQQFVNSVQMIEKYKVAYQEKWETWPTYRNLVSVKFEDKEPHLPDCNEYNEAMDRLRELECGYENFSEWKQVRKELDALYARRESYRTGYESFCKISKKIQEFQCTFQPNDGQRVSYGDVAWIQNAALTFSFLATCLAAFLIINATVGSVALLPFVGVVVVALVLNLFMPMPSSIYTYLKCVVSPSEQQKEYTLAQRALLRIPREVLFTDREGG